MIDQGEAPFDRMLATRLAGRCIHRFPELRPGAGFGDRDLHRSGRWQGDGLSAQAHACCGRSGAPPTTETAGTGFALDHADHGATDGLTGDDRPVSGQTRICAL